MMPKSKKERAFYFQAFMVIGYVGLRFFNPILSAFDSQFVTLMALLASYHVVQGAVDFKHGDHNK